ncbi:MAG: iron-sulfur cluster repair di-iron protein [Capnocytophaga sp.]|nr:iron-sulfur cluster repair di-iron protein [Capnocytophaga sp.]
MELKEKTIGEIVADDFRAAAIFKKYGIDFCCKGGISITEACGKKNIDENLLINDLNAIPKGNDQNLNVTDWPLDLLANYIMRMHHSYIREKTPYLLQFLDKLCRVHGDRHPELLEINQLFTESAYDLENHLEKEENILFPFIGKLVEAKENNQPSPVGHFGTVANPIAMMKHEHSAEGERFEKIATLTDGYNPPADACNTYRVTFAMLKEFEENLHQHIHLENNILFPKAIALEAQLN